MLVFYDTADINKVVAAYSHGSGSRAWDLFDRVIVHNARLQGGVHRAHHKVVIVPNPDFPIARGPEPPPGDPDRRPPQVEETLTTLEPMTQAERDARPLPVP